MKKIGALFMSGLIALCFSLSVSAQSSEKSLDQAELMKQFIGTWKAETGEDSIFLWEVKPCEEGYETTATWQASGNTYATTKGIIGFTWEKKVNMFGLYPNGWVARDLGEFVSKKKLVTERFNYDHAITLGKSEANFVTKDRFDYIFTWKGPEGTWDDAKVSELTYIRVK